jgi:23S rRNA (pseudouridine1915-N3)-methyltransferase
MRLLIAAVGRLKAGPERDLAERYRERAARIGRSLGISGIEVIDIRESPAREAERRLIEEAVALTTLIPDGAATVLLDPRGENLASEALAAQFRAWRDGGRPSLCFVIGGADGLGAALRQRADLTLAFGAATWPHQLVRIMLLEQIYRSLTMLSGHPYHRD